MDEGADVEIGTPQVEESHTEAYPQTIPSGKRRDRDPEVFYVEEKDEKPIKMLPPETLKELEKDGFKIVTITNQKLTENDLSVLGLGLLTPSQIETFKSNMPDHIQYAIPPSVSLEGSLDLNFNDSDGFMNNYIMSLKEKYKGVEVSWPSAAEIALINKSTKGKDGKGIFYPHHIRSRTLVSSDREPSQQNLVYYSGEKESNTPDFVDKTDPSVPIPIVSLTALLHSA